MRQGKGKKCSIYRSKLSTYCSVQEAYDDSLSFRAACALVPTRDPSPWPLLAVGPVEPPTPAAPLTTKQVGKVGHCYCGLGPLRDVTSCP